MVVKLDVDVLYWNESTKAWETSDTFCSKYPKRFEAEAKMLWLVGQDPELIGKLHIKNYYDNGFDNAAFYQDELF